MSRENTLGVLMCCAAVCTVAACSENGSLAAEREQRAQLAVNTAHALAGEQLDIAISYPLKSGTAILLLARRVAVTGTDPQQVPVNVELGDCLDDAARLLRAPDGCLLLVDVVLRDSRNTRIDSVRVGPLEARPGATISTPVITLQPPGVAGIR